MSGYTPKKIIRGRLGTKTNQTGLKMSGCPSLLGKKPSINRYIRRRVNCLKGVCGVPLHQGRIWKVNRRNLVPYCKEASTKCLAGAGGIGNINTPYYRTPAPGEKGCFLPSGKGLLPGIKYCLLVGEGDGTTANFDNGVGYSKFLGYIKNNAAAQIITDASCPCDPPAPLGDGSGGPPELLAMVLGKPQGNEQYPPSPSGELITVFNSAAAASQVSAIIIEGQVFLNTTTPAQGGALSQVFYPGQGGVMIVWRLEDGPSGSSSGTGFVWNTNPFNVPAGSKVCFEIIYNNA